MDLASVDHVLTTTRSVRKRLDFSRAIDRKVIEECIEIATQAPTGSNRQGWSFIVITDAAKRKAIADIYRRLFELYANTAPVQYPADDPRSAQQPKVRDSATYLAEHMHECPVFIIPCLEGRTDGASAGMQAGFWGSILPAAWSLMLALRARGIGTAWTSIHLGKEREVAKLLGIPDNVSQAVLFPLAYFTGDDFKVANRLPASAVTHWDSWGNQG
ncbi:MAG: nitroreductase family protein [Chloroflexi bacterium]|nr:nitroreductase family protein [Chloroflexota bacterium]